jgi:Zn-dependent protease
VRAHWSLLVVLFLLTQILAIGVLPTAVGGHRPAAYWLVGAPAAVVFVASILIHELAHALTARRYGIRVDQVTLWLLGGATELGSEPETPRAEAATAASGPAASLALGGGLAGLAWLIDAPPLLQTALAWLAAINLLLAGFNLLPAAPLDGGRLLRAVLWRRYRDRIRAIEVSARAGSFLGMGLIALGAFQVLSGVIFGLWLVLVGWFVMGAAAAERQSAAGGRLAGRVARDIMRTPPAVAPSWWTVADLVTELRRGYAGQVVFPLVDLDGRPRTLLWLREIQRVPVRDRDTTPLREAARSRVSALTVGPDTPVPELLQPMRAHGGIAVVVDDERVVGTISQAELAAAVTLANLAVTGDIPSASANPEARVGPEKPTVVRP